MFFDVGPNSWRGGAFQSPRNASMSGRTRRVFRRPIPAGGISGDRCRGGIPPRPFFSETPVFDFTSNPHRNLNRNFTRSAPFFSGRGAEFLTRRVARPHGDTSNAGAHGATYAASRPTRAGLSPGNSLSATGTRRRHRCTPDCDFTSIPHM